MNHLDELLKKQAQSNMQKKQKKQKKADKKPKKTPKNQKSDKWKMCKCTDCFKWFLITDVCKNHDKMSHKRK